MLKFRFRLFPIPTVPQEYLDKINEYLLLIRSNMSLIGLVFDVNVLSWVARGVIAIYGFEFGYKAIIWALRKLPIGSK